MTALRFTSFFYDLLYKLWTEAWSLKGFLFLFSFFFFLIKFMIFSAFWVVLETGFFVLWALPVYFMICYMFLEYNKYITFLVKQSIRVFFHCLYSKFGLIFLFFWWNLFELFALCFAVFRVFVKGDWIMGHPLGQLKVTVVQGKRLVIRDFKTSDPYVIVKLGNQVNFHSIYIVSKAFVFTKFVLDL